jgi:hypothetical protein
MGRKGVKLKGKTGNREKLLGRGKGLLKGKREGEGSRLSVGKSIGGANEEKEHAAARQEKGEISYAESFTKNLEKEKTEQ